MSFLSISYLIFIIIALILYYLLEKTNAQWVVLLVFSILFYFTYSIPAFLAVLTTGLLTYIISRFVQGKKVLLFTGIIVNIGTLVAIKYLNIIKYIPDTLFKDMSNPMFSLSIIIPIGISFYTLALTGYLIDIYRADQEPERNFLRLMLFTTFFPHILQGPIPRYKSFSLQFKEKHSFNYESLCHGAQLMLWGYFQKMVIADRAAIFVNKVYDDHMICSGTILFIASLLYTIQIYADFSGCVNIALGTAQLFDIKLTQNFRQPYFATSINDFWRRWHLTLSSWFRDYLYIPLGGNRKGKVRRWINVLLVFLASGFWHGVGLHFALWGLLHGIYQVIGAGLKNIRESLHKKFHLDKHPALTITYQRIITFLLVNFAWILFRAESINKAISIICSIFTDFSPWVLTDNKIYSYGISEKEWFVWLISLIVLFTVDFAHEKNTEIRKKIDGFILPLRWFFYFAAIIAVILFGAYGIGYDASSFIYMNF